MQFQCVIQQYDLVLPRNHLPIFVPYDDTAVLTQHCERGGASLSPVVSNSSIPFECYELKVPIPTINLISTVGFMAGQVNASQESQVALISTILLLAHGSRISKIFMASS